jgi:malonyl CoA-acyl carrier protein transacylase
MFKKLRKKITQKPDESREVSPENLKAFVFPGQGSQEKGMGKELFEKFPDIGKKADEILGYSLSELCIDDPEEKLGFTQYTQPALYTVNILHYLDEIETNKKKPDFVAGHSLGEYCALFAAGVLDFETGLKLVKKRGELMANAKEGGMAAVIGLSEAQIEEVLKENSFNDVSIANMNSPYQIVISGPKDDITDAKPAFDQAGCRVYIPVKVNSAFHSGLMADARDEFAEFIEQFSFAEIRIPIISNVFARPYSNEKIKQLLTDQITHPVKWVESIRYLWGLGVEEFIEMGPGKILANLIRRIKNESEPLYTKDKPPVIKTEKKAVKKEETKQPAAPIKRPVLTKKKNLVFMYAGQGAHHYNMGKELYLNNQVFKKSMDQCNSLIKQEMGFDLINVIYDDSKKFDNFDNILHTHPAVFCMAYSLSQVLIEQGIKPDCVLGYSLGEYTSLVTAGVLSLEEGLKIVLAQAKLLHEKCGTGSMLVILDDVSYFGKNPQLFEHCTLAAVNYNKCFVVSAPTDTCKNIHKYLSNNSIVSQLLACNYPFHSKYIESIKEDFEKTIAGISFNGQQMPIFSSVLAEEVSELSGRYLWDIIAEQVRFDSLVSKMKERGDFVYVDLSPTGTLSNFIKYGFSNSLPVYFSINPFGQNVKTMDNLFLNLEEFKS